MQAQTQDPFPAAFMHAFLQVCSARNLQVTQTQLVLARSVFSPLPAFEGQMVPSMSSCSCCCRRSIVRCVRRPAFPAC